MMKDSLISAGVLMDDQSSLSFKELCERNYFSEDWLIELVEHGLFHPVTQPMTQMTQINFDYRMLHRLHAAFRLQRDLELNVSGTVLVMELLDQLESLQARVHVLQRQIS